MMEVLSFMCLIIKHVKGDCERHVVLLTRCTPELGNPRFVLTEFTRVLQVYRTKQHKLNLVQCTRHTVSHVCVSSIGVLVIWKFVIRSQCTLKSNDLATEHNFSCVQIETVRLSDVCTRTAEYKWIQVNIGEYKWIQVNISEYKLNISNHVYIE